MKQNDSNTQMASTEMRYKELMKEADDFFKIELLRQAINKYKKALNFNIHSDMVKFRISECERMLRFEKKVTYILLSTAVIIIILFLIIF